MTRETKVEVWGQLVPVSVYQRSKSVWIATGTYLDHHIETKDSSANTALLRWKEAARYRGG